jgi:hypothetical protein
MDYGVRERLKSITPHNGNIDKDKISFIYALMNRFDIIHSISFRILQFCICITS